MKLYILSVLHLESNKVMEYAMRILAAKLGLPYEQSPGFRDNLVIEV